ncbi:MAG: hypothetical protein V4650_00830 [Pseudomonadota bacterium]
MTTLISLLASPQEVEIALQIDPDFKAFLALANKSGGERRQVADLVTARFRVVEPRVGVRDDLSLDDTIAVWGQPQTIRQLIAPSLSVDSTQLIHSLWRLETFDEVKVWLKAMQVVVRLAHDFEGTLRGHVLLAEAIIPMIETVERKEYVLPNGDMASDAITRNLGIRAKVFALDRQRRTPRSATGNSTIMDRLSRTLGRLNH